MNRDSLRHWKRSLCSLRHRSWKTIFGTLLSGCLLVYVLIENLQARGKHELQEIDMHPPPYTTLGECDRLPNGAFNCPDIRRKGNTLLRQAQLVMTRMLRIFDLIAKKHGIRYWLYRGTLIGAVRHAGHNPFDVDVDICIPKEDFDKFVEFGAKELPNDMFFQTEQTDPYYITPFYSGMYGKLRDTKSCYKYCLHAGCKHVDGLQLDMFVVEEDRNGNFIELYSHTAWFVRLFLYGPIVRKREDVLPLQEMNFDGFPLSVPRAWGNILKSLYGDFMEVPVAEPPGHIDTETLRSCEEIVE